MGLFFAANIAANLTGTYLIDLGGLPFSLGIFLMPLTFVVTDIIAEVFGYRISTLIVRSAIALQLIPLLLILAGFLAKPYAGLDLSTHFYTLFAATPRMILASLVAFSLSQSVDVFLFHRMKKATGGRWLWLRNNVSTMVAQAIDSALFLTIFLGGIIPFHLLIFKWAVLYSFKLTYAVLDTPIVYLATFLIRRYLQKDAPKKGGHRTLHSVDAGME